MRTLLIISGSLRSFRENIRTFPNCDIAVYIGLNDEDTYFNPHDTEFLFEDPRVRILVFEKTPTPPFSYRTEREQNIYKQWYKLYRFFKYIPSDYDLYIRIRPDVYLYDSSQLPDKPSDKLYIPFQNDRDGLNDQIAIGTYEQIRIYCETFNFIEPGKTSERTLLDTLTIPVQRFSLQYKLVLSTAKVIAIAGDSGSGKTMLCKLLRPLFLFDKVLEFETDRYHKWERGHAKWSELTHLDPNANHLEKLENDTFKLRLGDNIIAVDYDHSTGTFTHPSTIEPGETILLCGLHTMFSKQLRDLTDFKIYLDTSDEIKLKWKLQRDRTERNQTEFEIRTKIESRKQDYDTFIAPQMEYADLVIKRNKSSMTLIVRKKEWCSGFPGEWIGNAIVFKDESVDIRNQCQLFLEASGLPSIPIEFGYNGLIQFTVLRALYNKDG